MKLFICVFALAAVAFAEPEAEADPYLLYGGLYNAAPLAVANRYAVPYAANYYNGYPLAARAYANYAYAPYAYASPYHYNSYLAAAPATSLRIAKREAEPEADPYLLYGGLYNAAPLAVANRYAVPYAANYYNGYPLAARAYANYAYSPFAYASPYYGGRYYY